MFFLMLETNFQGCIFQWLLRQNSLIETYIIIYMKKLHARVCISLAIICAVNCSYYELMKLLMNFEKIITLNYVYQSIATIITSYKLCIGSKQYI